MSTLGWLASVASSVFVCSTLIQTLIEISDVEFVFPNWQYTLISIAFLVLTIFFNTWGAGTLPMIETVSLFGHILCFIVTLVPLWVMCPKNSAKDVFTVSVDSGGWGNVGTACLVTQVSVLYCNLGKVPSLPSMFQQTPNPMRESIDYRSQLTSRPKNKVATQHATYQKKSKTPASRCHAPCGGVSCSTYSWA